MTYNTLTGYWESPTDLYRMGTIVYANTTTHLSLYPVPNTTVTTTTLVEAERINHNEFLYINQSPYTKPSNARPVFVASDKGYKVYGNTALTQGVSCNYIKKPAKVQWAYTIVFQEPLYNAANSVDFELHPSEETELVIRILELSGLLIKDYQMYQVANSEEQQTIQQEKS